MHGTAAQTGSVGQSVEQSLGTASGPMQIGPDGMPIMNNNNQAAASANASAAGANAVSSADAAAGEGQRPVRLKVAFFVVAASKQGQSKLQRHRAAAVG